MATEFLLRKILFPIVFSIAFLATFVGSVSGGSASLISIPSWVALGFPLPTAVACDKLSATFWTFAAGRTYLHKCTIDWRLLAGLSLFGMAGAYLGTKTMVLVDATLLKKAVGLIILSLVALSLYKREYGLTTGEPRVGRFLGSLFGLPLGFYEGLLGSGNSIFTSLLLCRTRGFDLIAALGHYYFVAFVWCAFAAFLYLRQGFFEPSLMLPAVLGSILGGLTGSYMGRRSGAKFVKLLFIFVGILLGLKLVVT